jgi:hypothetical protein
MQMQQGSEEISVPGKVGCIPVSHGVVWLGDVYAVTPQPQLNRQETGENKSRLGEDDKSIAIHRD